MPGCHSDRRDGRSRDGNVARVGTWGPGAFDNDDALDLLDTLTGQDPASRRETLERIFRTTREHPQDLNWTLGPAEVVAAAAVVAAGLPAGEAVLREITGHHYDTAALGLTDASVAVLAARHRTTRSLTLDERDFRPMRPLYGTAFTLLPADARS